MSGWEATPVVILKHDRIIVESAPAPRPPLDHLAAFCRDGEFDSRSCYGQPLLHVEVQLIVEVPELMEMLDSLNEHRSHPLRLVHWLRLTPTSALLMHISSAFVLENYLSSLHIFFEDLSKNETLI